MIVISILMAYRPFSVLLIRRISLFPLNPKPPAPTSSFYLSELLTSKSYSTSQDPATDPKPTSLSARLSFVFDQIDAIEKERDQKHQTLQRIRAWRESKKTQLPPSDTKGPESEIGSAANVNPNPIDAGLSESKLEATRGAAKCGELAKKEVEVLHPWPEWIELMQRLVQQNYFDHRRRDEDKLVQDLGFDCAGLADDAGLDFIKDFKSVQTACLNFGKDRFDILRSLSRQDIQILVGFGCPTADGKVVFSAKLLRKLVHLDEGDVCSSCSLRSSCERAYLLTNKEDEARTIDVMRVLLMFGFDPVNGSSVTRSLLKQKCVKTVVRKLLHEVVKLSSVPIDPNLPPPVIKKPPPKLKQPPPPPKKRVGRDDVEMKKGDWLCPKCDFMNFAKNTVCLQCDAKRPKRQLLPGEWECPECNFLNYRRNMACFHCECKRPPDEFLENKIQDKQRTSKPGMDNRMSSQRDVSNAWNFDFDDDESDGADVAAFEYADAHAIDEDFPSDTQAQHGNFGRHEGEFEVTDRVQGSGGGEYSNPSLDRPGLGFDDFEDEDDIDSYELEHNDSAGAKTSEDDFSEFEDSSDEQRSIHSKSGRFSQKGKGRVRTKKLSFGSEDDDLTFDLEEQRSIHSKFKSGRGSGTAQKGKGKGQTKKLSFGSDTDEDYVGGLYSDEDEDLNEVYASRRNNGNKHASGRRNFSRDRQPKSNGSHRANLFSDDFEGSSRQSYGNRRESKGKGRNWQVGEGRKQGTPYLNKSRGGQSEKQGGRFNKYRMDEKDFGEFRNSRRVIER
ncbi:uncharacterized protein LOC129307151 [Prosopis cineraria]|uniref:uncharacterized protein LOC129307151 n=1 Tax=Prosopis cineraria TaxID=364024 RepID=UPI00240FEDA7|nr:uncharacterized protein LOC129307151 [Prosopis cineraria]